MIRREERLPGPLEDPVAHPGEGNVPRREPPHPDLPAARFLDHVARLRVQNGQAVGGHHEPLGPCAPAEQLEERVHALRLEAERAGQESILGRLGWDVTRSTLCDQILACANVLTPLYRLMCDRVRLSVALHTDDTPIPLLAPRRTAHAWAYVGDTAHPYTVFDLSVGRSRDAPTAFLKGYTGFVHADGYAGYNSVFAAGATRVGCWAHARRYFFDARSSDPERAHEALARIRALYAVEREAKDQGLTGAERATHRQQHSAPVLAAFGDWLAEQRPRVLPKSTIGEAVTYATNQWHTLGVYPTDGRLTLDNAPAEQAIRPLCVGRRNWLHLGGDGGLQPTAVMLQCDCLGQAARAQPVGLFEARPD